MPIDHLDLVVTDFERSLRFYRGLLAPLGYVREGPIVGERGEHVLYFGHQDGIGHGAISLRSAQSEAHGVPYDRYGVGVHHVACRPRGQPQRLRAGVRLPGTRRRARLRRAAGRQRHEAADLRDRPRRPDHQGLDRRNASGRRRRLRSPKRREDSRREAGVGLDDVNEAIEAVLDGSAGAARTVLRMEPKNESTAEDRALTTT